MSTVARRTTTRVPVAASSPRVNQRSPSMVYRFDPYAKQGPIVVLVPPRSPVLPGRTVCPLPSTSSTDSSPASSLSPSTLALSGVSSEVDCPALEQASFDADRHTELIGYGCSYHRYDEYRHEPERDKPTKNLIRMFVGQVRREVTGKELMAIFNTFTGIKPVSCVPCGHSCFFLKVNASSVQAALELNGRLAFDKNGFWHATTSEAAAEMAKRMEGKKEELRAAFLPQSPIVVRYQ